MKTLVLPLALFLTLGGSSVFAQTKGSPPSSPLVIRTDIGYGFSLSITADAKTTRSEVVYYSLQFLASTRATISVKDCGRLADAIEDAAKTLANGKRFESDRVGDVTISTGVADVYTLTKDGKWTTAKRKVVMLGGGATGLFSKPLQINLQPADAGKFAVSLRATPAIHARLMSSIDFDAMWKKK